ncbi:hypothetical protein PR002_g14300 [Phytophthora rubi]|uniref:Uncharacterized protein n=1 Tax=Phytophthora rubi TaxID=129364 RepID=A0A6A3L8A4_9STRA|nr:hypothetical protein PR002_g14300 [Phytophthora rubi]
MHDADSASPTARVPLSLAFSLFAAVSTSVVAVGASPISALTRRASAQASASSGVVSIGTSIGVTL